MNEPNSPLRIGILGASRIAKESLCDVVAASGDCLAAVAARDVARAEQFAAKWGVERVYPDYAALLTDESLDLVYVGLPNSLHAKWTVRALSRGRNVLVEKPIASNLAEFLQLEAALDAVNDGVQGPWMWEAFHYQDHPAFAQLLQTVAGGEFGEVRELRVNMCMPEPPATDPRLSFALAGGAIMDVGCYVLHSLLTAAAFWQGVDCVPQEPGQGLPVRVVRASAECLAGNPRLDMRVVAELALGEIPVSSVISMRDEWDFSFTVLCAGGAVQLPNFIKLELAPEMRIWRWDAANPVKSVDTLPAAPDRVVALSSRTTYSYQLERVRRQLRAGVRDRAELQRSRETMALIDELYRSCQLPVRPAAL